MATLIHFFQNESTRERYFCSEQAILFFFPGETQTAEWGYLVVRNTHLSSCGLTGFLASHEVGIAKTKGKAYKVVLEVLKDSLSHPTCFSNNAFRMA